ncbi:MAG: pyridoxal-phosphate dependent enzyme [Ahniella sp.]|nr:pyridoxal-phosphate dependent enzyme [Ahniella sp.]
MSSVKDRLAGLSKMPKQGSLLKPGQTVVSCHPATPASLALVCAAEGLSVRVVHGRSVLDRKASQADARPGHGPADAWSGTRQWHGQAMPRIRRETRAFLARQFDNPANPAYHRSTTAAEILQDFAGADLDYFVTGYGTGGTHRRTRCSR